MKHIKKYESLLSDIKDKLKPKKFEKGEKLKFILNGETIYCQYEDEVFNTDNVVKFFIPIDNYALVYFFDKNGKLDKELKRIKKSKLMELTKFEKDIDKYNL